MMAAPAKAPAALNGAAVRVAVLGANGRLGRLLQRAWTAHGTTLAPLWLARQGAEGPGWRSVDALAEPEALAAACHGCEAILNLAGVPPAPAARYGRNTDLALACLDAARTARVRWVFLLSSAAVYGKAAGPLSEERAPMPCSGYGRAKLAMEDAIIRWQRRAGAAAPRVCCLRLGNVAGADRLLGGMRPGVPVVLDSFTDGGTPLRSYIGPQALARMLERLILLATSGTLLPPILNIASFPALEMAALLDMAGQPWLRRPAGPDVLARVELDITRLAHLLPPARRRGSAEALVADWRALQRTTSNDLSRERKT